MANACGGRQGVSLRQMDFSRSANVFPKHSWMWNSHLSITWISWMTTMVMLKCMQGSGSVDGWLHFHLSLHNIWIRNCIQFKPRKCPEVAKRVWVINSVQQKQLLAVDFDSNIEHLDSQLKESWIGYFLVPAEKKATPQQTELWLAQNSRDTLSVLCS